MRNPRVSNFIWSEKYRPKMIKEALLPRAMQEKMEGLANAPSIPNLIFSGSPGLGKTTCALALINDQDYDYFLVNGSKDGNMDTLRGDLSNYASSMSLEGKRKVILIDEADHLNPNSTQPALRGFIEEFADNCSFIFTCNYLNKLLPALRSRFSIVEFHTPSDPAERKDLLSRQYKRVAQILKTEGVSFDPKTLLDFMQKHFPDMRKTLNELQAYAAKGTIDAGILSNYSGDNILELVTALKSKNFNGIRAWVFKNAGMDHAFLARYLFENSKNFLEGPSIPQLVLLLADYDYKGAFVVDKEINTIAMLTCIARDCKFT